MIQSQSVVCCGSDTTARQMNWKESSATILTCWFASRRDAPFSLSVTIYILQWVCGIATDNSNNNNIYKKFSVCVQSLATTIYDSRPFIENNKNSERTLRWDTAASATIIIVSKSSSKQVIKSLEWALGIPANLFSVSHLLVVVEGRRITLYIS